MGGFLENFTEDYMESVKQDIDNLDEFCVYMGELILRENERGISGVCDLFLRSMMMCAEDDLRKKRDVYNAVNKLKLEDILGEKNEWEEE